MNVAPDHHRRYALAWDLYQDSGLTEESRRALEKEMDAAQTLFKWGEFQDFKRTLPGYEKYWKQLKNDLSDKIKRMKKGI